MEPPKNGLRYGEITQRFPNPMNHTNPQTEPSKHGTLRPKTIQSTTHPRLPMLPSKKYFTLRHPPRLCAVPALSLAIH